MLLKREPALIIGAIIALVQIGINVWQGDMSTLPGIGEPLATLLGAFVIRQSSYSENTIRKAGISPADVNDRAKDAMVPKYEGK